MIYFFDTSALVKIYHKEIGSDKALDIYRNKNKIYISEFSMIEFLSTLYKKLRTREIDKNTLNFVKNKFFDDTEIRYKIINFHSSIIEYTYEIIENNGDIQHIFSLDALQIGFYSLLAEKKALFVCADLRLNAILNKINIPVYEII